MMTVKYEERQVILVHLRTSLVWRCFQYIMLSVSINTTMKLKEIIRF